MNIERGEIAERMIPGTGMKRWELIEILALPGDPDFYCGGAPEAEAADFVLICDERGCEYPIHRDWLKPEYTRS
jgi:hypothetical protein